MHKNVMTTTVRSCCSMDALSFTTFSLLFIIIIDETNHVEQARAFLETQQDRITVVEETLLKATEAILPMMEHDQCMTVTELLQVCISLQRANIDLMKRLDDRMNRNYAGKYQSVLTKERIQECQVNAPSPSPPSAAEFSTPLWQQLPLEQVVETDNETDATTTPGSTTFLSPPLSSSQQKQGGGTPVTPSLDSLHLRYASQQYYLTVCERHYTFLLTTRLPFLNSSNTEAVLKETPYAALPNDDDDDAISVSNKRHSLDAIETWRARKYSMTFSFHGTDTDESLRDIDVEAVPLVDEKKNDNVPLPESAACVVETSKPSEPDDREEESRNNETSSQEVDNDEVVSVATTASTNNGKERDDSSTIVGCDVTFADDDTAVATVATVLGRGRQRQGFEGIPEEKSVMEEESTMRVSLNAGASNNDTTARLQRSSKAVEHVDDSERKRLSTLAQATDTTIVGYNETLIDDETVAEVDETVIGRGRARNSSNRSSATATTLSPETSPGEHTVKEIIVDTSASSCSMDHDNSTTMDLSVLDSTIATSPRSFVKETEDETTVGSLLVTPVLDRYRLEADDTSVGVKVVPNKRGTHHQVPKQKQKDLLTKYGAGPPSIVQAANVKNANAKEGDALPTTSPFVTQRTRTVYRKTPHPKKAGFARDANENEAPNRDAYTPLKSERRDAGSKAERNLRSPFTRISLPELTHRPYRTSLPSQSTARRLPFSASKAKQPERRHTISLQQQNSMSRTPLTAAWIAKHMPEESRLVESLDVSEDSSFTFI